MWKFLSTILIAIMCGIGLVLTAAALFLATTPRPTNLKGCLTTEMYHVRLCPKDAGYVKLRDISLNMRNAVIVSEDGAFYSHHGFDWIELQNSFDKNIEDGAFARGGSTITQQLAKNVYLTSEKSLIRKIKEAMITVQIEKLLTKDEILEKYLNVVEFGDHVYGVKAASQLYFKKSPSQLTVAEGAFLAFLLPNPKKYSQSFRQKKLTKFAGQQVRIIVERLYRFKRIGEVEHASALEQVVRMFGPETDQISIDEPSGADLDFTSSTDPDDANVIGYPAGLQPPPEPVTDDATGSEQ